jgi:kinesin family protein 4/21/27
MATSSSVRVGIRIRPLVAKEKGQSIAIESHDSESIGFKGQTFTFDHVFGSDMSQIELYERTAASMLKNILEGYNCTIIAYGQTGSGKTFTMGTSDVNNHDISSLGLIPRFVNDLFQNLNDPVDEQITYKVKASFLEIYGEDVYDLISASGSSNSVMSRNSLAVREDEHGHVFVQGQVEQEVADPESALEALSTGSSNRITAATVMNAGSSRSHAVFTLSITQYVKSGEDEIVQNMSSKLTFVDLAGSERIKRTGAEGQRMKEGIQINSGLFNLGQVINSLADEQKLRSGQKPTFVPYRNSKLTHLLKDALGGNSQTLFLACISPAESNESETYSTLSYARQARNIQNKPVKNMDETQAEMRRLKLGMRTWMLKAVKLAFCPAGNFSSIDGAPPSASKLNGVFSPGAATLLAQLVKSEPQVNSSDEEVLLQRPEVIEFIEAINASIKDKVNGLSPSPRKVRLSLGMNTALQNRTGHLMSPSFTSPRRNRLSALRRVDTPSCSWMPTTSEKEEGGFPVTSGRESILFGLDLNAALEAADNNVNDSQALVERMMDVINEEKRILGHQPAGKETSNAKNTSIAATADSATVTTEITTESMDFDACIAEEEDDEEELKVVDKLIAEKEEILNKLMDNIKGYSVLKAEFEKLVDAINGLEMEKKDLENELEKAKKNNPNSSQLEKIKERFVTVKEELRKMKDDRKNKEQAYKMMQKDTKVLDTMQRELQKLKESKVSLLKQQKSQFNELQKMKKEQVVKMQVLKKSDVKKQQQMNALKSELAKKERIIGHRDKEIGRMTMKLKACEDHITQLLKIQNRNRQNSKTGPSASSSNSSTIPRSLLRNNNNALAHNLTGVNSSLIPLDSAEMEHLCTSKGIVDQAVLSQVEKRVSRLLYEKKTAALRKLNMDMVTEAADLEAIIATKQALLEEQGTSADSAIVGINGVGENSLAPEKKVLLESYEQSMRLAETKIERMTKQIDLLNADIDDLSLQLEKIEKSSFAETNSIWDSIGTEVVLGLSAGQSHALILDLLSEKITLSTSLRTSEAEGALLLTKLEDEIAMKVLLAKHAEDLRVVHRDRLVQLEKQRLEDVWVMMKAASSNASTAESEELQKGVAFQKTRALEQALEEHTQALHDVTQQFEVAQAELLQQTTKATELGNQLQIFARVNAVANDSNVAQGGNTSGFLDAEYLNKLQQLWEETGSSMEERHVVMDCLLKSQELAKERAMSDAERALKAASEDFHSREISVKRLISVLGGKLLPENFEQPNWSKLQSMPKLSALSLLESNETRLKESIDVVTPQLRSLRDQLDYYVAEMWLSREDLPRPLQRLSLLSSTLNSSSWELDALVPIMASNELSLNDINDWQEELKVLNLQRVHTTANLITLREQCVSLCEELGFFSPSCSRKDENKTKFMIIEEKEKQELSELLEQVFGEDADVSSRARSAVVQILTQQTSSNPPGAQSLFIAFEKLKLLLESVRLNRSTVSACLNRLQERFQTEILAESGNEDPQTSNVSCDRQIVDQQTQSLLSLPSMLKTCKQRLMEEVEEVLVQVTGDKPTAAQFQQIITKNVDVFTAQSHDVLKTIEEVVEELQGMEAFVEENWLQLRISHLLRTLLPTENDVVNIRAREILYLKTEKARLETLRETMSELQRTDAYLVKHMTELEEFEERSKADRVKALSGNSKMLIEEEKFRKAGKKKYESISEKMFALYAKVQSLAANSNVTTGDAVLVAPLEVRVSISSLSGPGQCLLRGGVSKERVELMRLHTAAAAAAAAATAMVSPPHTLYTAAAAAGATNTRRASIESKEPSAASVSSGNSTRAGGGSKENISGAANRALVGGKGVLKPLASSSATSRLRPKTSGHTLIGSASTSSSSSVLSSLATFALENPLTFASDIGSSHAATPKNAAVAGRRYSFQPPTPPHQNQTQGGDSSLESSPLLVDVDAVGNDVLKQIPTITPGVFSDM